MPTLSRAQDASRQRIHAAAAGGYAPEEFGRRLIDAVASAVPSDDQRLWTVDPVSLLLNRLVAASAGDSSFRLRWLRDIYLRMGTAIPYFAPHELMRHGATAVAFHDRQERTLGLPSQLRDRITPELHYQEYHNALTPAGGSTRLCLRAGGQWIGMFEVVRRDRRRPLAPTDYAFLRLVGPTIARAFHASLAREQALLAQHGDPPPRASGILILTADRRLAFASPSAETWLRALPDARRDEHAPLPTAVWAAVAGLLDDASGVLRPVATIIVPSVAGPIRVEASPGGEDGSVAVVLTAVRPPAAPDVPELWPLTAQERRVVQLVLTGSGNRALAASLHVTENTVETHLGHIYEKLGVHSRIELVGRLFRETYLSGFETEGGRAAVRG